MKKILFLLLSIGLTVNCFCAEYYYYYHGERKYLTTVNQYLCLTVTDDIRENIDTLEKLGAIMIVSDKSTGLLYVRTPEASIYNRVLSYCASSNMVKTYSPVFTLGDGDFLLAGASRVMVTLNSKSDSTILKRALQRYNYSITYIDPYDSLFYIISTNQHDGTSAIGAAQILYESRLFRAVSPDFIEITEDYLTSVENEGNNPDRWQILEQWNFYNASDTTVDINAQQAWQITTGNGNVVVAVLDAGVELDHPALINNLTAGYDAITDTYPAGSPPDTTTYSQHGTKCTGVIVAEKVSPFGMRGLANGCKVMPIRVLGASNFTSSFILAINFAKNNGASVISMSWFTVSDDNKEIALQDAIDNGRNGKGCVAIASAGEETSSMIYFPRCMADVIVVGATDKCGMRTGNNAHVCFTGTNCCSSNHGEQLDVMAPGCLIPTTKMNHQYHLGLCTSLSTPQVSGVAALILSVNSNLSSKQVRYIIENTAQKIGGYSYTTNANHPNGTWNTEMGHGLVDAGAAVAMAQALLSIPDVYIKDTPNDNGIEPNQENAQMTNSPDIWITDDGGNAVNQVLAGETYQVHIRVRNLGNANGIPTFPTISIYWSVSNANLLWNYHWFSLSPLCGSPRCGTIANNYSVGIVHPYSNKTLTFDWTAPLYNNMQCSLSPAPINLSFVAKIHDGRIIIGESATSYPIDKFVRQNNNVAMKKITFIPTGLLPLFHLSPNPAHRFATLSWEEPLRADVEWRMFLVNPMGQIIRNATLDTRANSLLIDIQGLPVGSYTVVVSGSNGFQWDDELVTF